jgi:hypothetical protein
MRLSLTRAAHVVVATALLPRISGRDDKGREVAKVGIVAGWEGRQTLSSGSTRSDVDKTG